MDWMEVGRRQRPTVTRSAGHPDKISPISLIFRGMTRSEVSSSAVYEPFLSLPLDIASPEVHSIVDALRKYSRQELVDRGANGKSLRQMFIDKLPPILILHLKRFELKDLPNGEKMAVKIWKKVSYPLELEIPHEALSKTQRLNGSPRYRLSAAVYHHGKDVSHGHYTADVCRQDGREWIRFDDTAVRRIRSEDVAEGGSRADTASPIQKDKAAPPTSNRFAAVGDQEKDRAGWSQATASNKKRAQAVNGSSADKQDANESTKEGKVAYLLFYQRI